MTGPETVRTITAGMRVRKGASRGPVPSTEQGEYEEQPRRSGFDPVRIRTPWRCLRGRGFSPGEMNLEPYRRQPVAAALRMVSTSVWAPLTSVNETTAASTRTWPGRTVAGYAEVRHDLDRIDPLESSFRGRLWRAVVRGGQGRRLGPATRLAVARLTSTKGDAMFEALMLATLAGRNPPRRVLGDAAQRLAGTEPLRR